ncbi:DUF4238 domain-containing protein [Pseudomonas poae]|nr:DUF4238 domain-containing protein [Pseudomonas poae]
MTTRRQHYVWRHYLRAWANDEKIWCRRDGKIFATNLMNIGQQRDFYALRRLSTEEETWILEQTRRRHNGDLNKHNEKFLSDYKLVSEATTQTKNCEELEALRIQFEENMMTKIETSAIENLSKLQQRDSSFFLINEHRASFSHFLMIQLLRTKRMSHALKNSLKSILDKRGLGIENIWPPYKFINAAHMALTVYAEPKYKISLIRNTSNIEFITGDQPIFNIHAVESTDQPPEKTDLFYPISPSLAIILGKENHAKQATEIDVIKYDKWIKKSSHEQIHSSSRDLL